MLTFVIGSVLVIVTFLVGGLFAFLTSRLDTTITKTHANIAAEEKAVRPGATMGYEISTDVDADEQIRQARTLAAKQAAAMPRGANFKVGNKESASDTLATASKGVEEDPWTAAKIAKFHGWAGAKTGIPAGGTAVAAAPVAAAPAAGGKIVLVPGKDYPYIELTDDMPPADKRKARIANSKAKSAAMKAAKAAGVTAAPVAAAAVAAPVAAAAAPVAVDVEAPVLIPMTDDMAPDEKRKARIANSKAKSKFNKALKAAGVDPKTVNFDDDGKVIWPQGAPPASAAPAAVAAPVAAAAAPAVSSGPLDLAALGIDPPDFMPMTDDMAPDEIRKARINNSKAKSAFNKALKGAGVDPKTVEIDDSGNVSFKEGAAPAVTQPVVAASAPAAASAAPAPATGGAVDLAALGIDPPELTELSDDMSPDEKRAARIANSKAKSAFNKALKAAGIDPKSVKL